MSGVYADELVNTDEALAVGSAIISNFSGCSLQSLTLKKSQQVRTLATTRKPVKIAGEIFHISSQEMFQRLTSLISSTTVTIQTAMHHELSSVSPALFLDDGTMRKSTKSKLANYITGLGEDIIVTSVQSSSCMKIYDGCSLIHKMIWPKTGTFHSVCQAFVTHLLPENTLPNQVTVIFDSYSSVSTKEPERKRRRTSLPHPDVQISPSVPLPTDKSAFLANNHNKQAFIFLLAAYLEKKSITVLHAGEESDADVLIVKKVVDFSRASEVLVTCDDTDVLVLLIYHVKTSYRVLMKTQQHFIDIQAAQVALGSDICAVLPFIHAMSGCDTTSSLFGIGKVKMLKLLQQSPELCKKVRIFGEKKAKSEITKLGEEFVCLLYQSNSSSKNLNEIRYSQYIAPRYVPLERMAPTSRAVYYHTLRAHMQVNTWKYLKTSLDFTEYGFSMNDGCITPIITDMEPAPAQLLQNICCSCKSMSRLCKSCSCTKFGIACSMYCKCEGNCSNSGDIQL